MLLMIDNYDSFTYNLVQYFGELGEEVRTFRNDEITLDEVAALQPDRICISPGPCTPHEAGISVPLLQRFAGQIPILGVCLGHQSIGAAFGGKIVRAKEIMHGKMSADRAYRGRRVSRAAEPVHGHPLPLAGDRARLAAGLPGSDRVDRRRRNHGRAPSRSSMSRACSSIRNRSCPNTAMRS